jgi:hypothetical protein
LEGNGLRDDPVAALAAFLDDSLFSPPLLPKMLTKPRTVCFCQPVVATISASVALSAFIVAITLGFLVFAGFSCALLRPAAMTGDFFALPFVAQRPLPVT